ncbi:MAG: hypothetical protein Fur002_03530 [Anaerolineales bacterium]
MAENKKLDGDKMLQAEFNYIANTAFQANEDRSRVISFYFVSTASLVAAILSAQFSSQQTQSVSLGFALLFAVLTLLGALTLAQLARLRSAWHESAQAMNQIKNYYIELNPPIAAAFKWRMEQIPPTDKPYSIANIMALEVTLLGGVTAGAMMYYVFQAAGEVTLLGWLFAAAAAFAGGYALWKWYKYLLVDNQ